MNATGRLKRENEELRRRLSEAEDALRAIREDRVDAIVTDGDQGARIFSRAGSEHIYRVLFETMYEAALTVAPDGTILFCNQRFCDLIQTPLEQALGRKLESFTKPAEREALARLLWAARTRPVQGHFALQAGDGTGVPVQMAVNLLESGERPSICVVASDLTELQASAQSINVLRKQRRELEQTQAELRSARLAALNLMEDAVAARREAERSAAELRESEERLRLAAETTGFGTYDFNPENRFSLWSPQVFAIVGLPEKTPISEAALLRLVHPDDRQRIVRRIEKARDPARPERHEFEFRVVRPNGELRWLRDTGRTIFGGGRPVRIIGTLQDITKRKHAEERLRQFTEQLESRVENRTAELKSVQEQLRALTNRLHELQEQERAQLARELHDQFGAALTALKIDLYSTMRQWPDKLNGVQAKVKGMSDLIDDTLESLRRTAALLRPRLLDDFGLVAAIEWQCLEFERRTGVRCVINLPPDLSLDRQRSTVIFRILQESLTNITRHAKATAVAVRLRENRGKVLLKITDNGVGISAEAICDHKSIGLFGMQERAYAFGGHVRFTSRGNQGTTVTVEIPLDNK
jgi:two-component system sensor histidine kinase UhpB